MAGDDFCQKVFYKVCTFIWCANDLRTGHILQAHQDALICHVFGYKDKHDFLNKEKEATEVSTWDGRHRGFFPHKALIDMANWVNILGPLAGIYGRDIEQYLMHHDRTTLIPEHKFNESVVQ